MYIEPNLVCISDSFTKQWFYSCKQKDDGWCTQMPSGRRDIMDTFSLLPELSKHSKPTCKTTTNTVVLYPVVFAYIANQPCFLLESPFWECPDLTLGRIWTWCTRDDPQTNTNKFKHWKHIAWNEQQSFLGKYSGILFCLISQ